jgi:drug/metabolite transporter (DMT)-like permease
MLAMFAAFSEASAATTLPYLDEESRKFFIGFIVIFPCALSALWFFTLHFNSTTPPHPTEPDDMSNQAPTSRVLHVGFLSTTFDAAQLTPAMSMQPLDAYKINQFEVLLIQRT